MKTYTPLEVHHQEDQETTLLNNHYEETTSSNTSLLCFNIFCFSWKNKRGQHQTQGEKQETWLVKKLKNLKEKSEVVAGPKWKNLLRKMGKYFSVKKPRCQFQYDPESYQHNFDQGVREEEDSMMHAFSSRFAPSQCKLSSQTN
ncbi:hypothetical protein LIER_18313 [Lithospermum erythrorhizon]|uniref:Uncharacterized protein n=1 Tax=Lithospermum erythrorhizon TaxID=34254 RepID=A0AAV3QGP5_LITER